jgi:hydrogenase/urease accessory protein HupE
MNRWLWLAPAIWIFALWPGAAVAHDVQPIYLEIRQTGATQLAVMWKAPARKSLDGLVVVFPPAWKIASGPMDASTPDNDVKRWVLTCPRDGLDGQNIGVAGLETIPADVMVRVVRLDGTAIVTRLNPAMTSFVIEAKPGFWHLALTYTRLGIEHILMGVDHLLFVLGLLLIVKNRWVLLKTITAFTVAHSLTLAVATLGYASAPVQPLNAAIALSIFFLGPEIVRKERGGTSLTIEHPWVIAFLFGLVHGFGFASGLTALGLTHSEIPPALLLFNVGVEIGQLMFVGVILALEKSYRVLDVHWSRWAQWIPAYTVGGLGAFWTIQRVAMLMGVIQ